VDDETRAEMQVLKDRIGLLEQQVSLFAAISAQMLNGRWTGEDTGGELPHAAAQLVALLGGEEPAAAIGFSPVPFGAG
jgi:hypothetical protein